MFEYQWPAYLLKISRFHRCFSNILLVKPTTWFVRKWDIGRKWLNIGSCNLHVTQDAFKTAFKSAEWNIEKLMKASYNLFHDLPTRRADYVTVTECENFPHAFYSAHWVEDQKLAERLCSIWGNIDN